MLVTAAAAASTTPQTDFWVVVIPGYIGAVGGLISAIVGAVALLQSLRARGGVRSLAAGLNAEQRSEAGVADASEASGSNSPNLTTPSAPMEVVTWSIVKAKGDQYRLINRSRTVAATVTGIVEVSDGDDLTLDPDVHFPVEVPPQAPIPFYLARTFTSPSVTALRIEWEEPGRGPQSVTLYE